MFLKEGYLLSFVMVSGKAGLIMVVKKDRSPFSAAEIDTFLQSFADGYKWTQQPSPNTQSRWRRDDGSEAQYDPATNHLAVVSLAYIAAEPKTR